MVRRKGLGSGRGKGYKNILGQDKQIHSMSSKGIKQPTSINESRLNSMDKNIKSNQKEVLKLKKKIIENKYNNEIKKLSKKNWVCPICDGLGLIKEVNLFSKNKYNVCKLCKKVGYITGDNVINYSKKFSVDNSRYYGKDFNIKKLDKDEYKLLITNQNNNKKKFKGNLWGEVRFLISKKNNKLSDLKEKVKKSSDDATVEAYIFGTGGVDRDFSTPF